MRVLDRKLIRDLRAMTGQAIAIALVIAAGLSMFVAYLSNFESLRRTQTLYYERYRFGDVFAACARAPLGVAARLAELPGVEAVEARTVVDVRLDIPGAEGPVNGRVIGIPADGRPAVNDLFLRRGRWIEPGRADDVLVNEGFGRANGLTVGARFAAVINGRRQVLHVVGWALSPEYTYVLPPGELIPDDRRFGIVWMERRALAKAFDMDGAFNDVSLRVDPGVSPDRVVTTVDAILRPWGGGNAVPRRRQQSHWFIDAELRQLESFGYAVPIVFLSVAAFLLNLAMGRVLAVQRPQIATLKALGYGHGTIAWHYVKWSLAIALFGSAIGLASGAWLGSAMIALYNEYFRFPLLVYSLSKGISAAAMGIGLACAVAGAAFAVRRAVSVPPAEAMREEPPARYRTSIAERLGGRWLSPAAKMVLRNLERHPWRTLTSVGGVACATAILFFGFLFIDVSDLLIRQQFTRVQRQDATVTFVEPRAWAATLEVAAMPGVRATEAIRSVPTTLRVGHRSRQVVLTGQPAHAELSRVLDASGREVQTPPEGLVLSKILGDVLAAHPGDLVRIEVLTGTRPTLELPIAALVDDVMGVSAYMDRDALNRALREGRTVTAVHATVDEAEAAGLYRRLRGVPGIAGIAVTADARRSFERIMAENLGLMVGATVLFAGIIAVGVVYNAARISLSERHRELASLRVLGFTIAEISAILLGELTAVTLAAIVPGLGLGWLFAKALVASLQSEVYRLPFTVTPRNVAWSALTILIAAAVSGLAVRRRLDHLDLVAVLKTRE